jgi:hypothetical protein
METDEVMVEERVVVDVTAAGGEGAGGPGKRERGAVYRDMVSAGEVAEAAAEREREGIYGSVHVWRGEALRPFSISRRCLWERMVAMDAPLPAGVLYSENLPAWLGHAVKLLWLCTREPEAWAGLRHDLRLMIAASEAWADGEAWDDEECDEAVVLGLRIWREARQMRAVPRPSGKGGSGLGN